MYAVISAFVVFACAVAVAKALRDHKRNQFLSMYSQELEATVASLKQELREANFRETILVAKLDQIDKVLSKTGNTQVKQRIQPFLLSVEKKANGAR